jgi:hypothetical protein
LREVATERVRVRTSEFMIVRFFSAVLIAYSTVNLWAAPLDQYVSSTPVFITNPPPQINAITWINQTIFEVADFGFSPLPYETLNTRNFRNSASGRMFGNPGFRFDYYSGNVRQSMDTWVNKGSIATENSTFLITATTTPFFFFSPANWLLVSSDSIVNSGTLSAGSQGMIRLEGGTLDLARGRIRTGSSVSNTFLTGGFLLSSNYFNDLGVNDLWWGVGSNNVVRGQGTPMRLDGSNFFFSFFDPNFTLPFIQSAPHEVIQPSTLTGFYFTNTVQLPYFSFRGYTAAAYTSQIGTNITIQVVFVPTNSFDTNLITDVRFASGFFGGSGPATAIVGFHTRERDIVLDKDTTNSVYLADALATQTNASYAQNLGVNTRRPNTFAVSKTPPFSLFFSQPPNATYTNGMLYNPNYVSNTVPSAYAGYAASVTSVAVSNPLLSDPTNYPGRIEISGTDLNMRDARIRADTTLTLKASNVTSNRNAQISAPFLYLDLGTTQPQFVISNLAPSSVSRLSGQIYAWSATWNNTEITPSGANNVRFHVLVVDHTLTSFQPVTVNQFIAKGNNIVLHDFVNAQQKLKFRGNSLDIKGSGGLIFPPGANWASTSMVNIVYFTNNGIVSLTGSQFAGPDRGYGYYTFVNRGTNTAQVQSIQADYFDNPGCMAALSGAFTLNADRVQLRGRPATISTTLFTNLFFSGFGFGTLITNVTTNVLTNASAKISASSDIIITANNITLSNAFLQAGASSFGALVLSASNRLTDSGVLATNYLLVSAGIQVLQKPKNFGDLLGTYVRSSLEDSAEAQHIWSGLDFGPVALGYSNNLALGKLTLDGSEASLFRFASAPGKKGAMYVDYLELLNNATNFGTGLLIDPSLVIYFANANLPASKLDGAQDGHLRWVPTFAGPLSSTNITYPSGKTYTFNIALARDKDIDSDGDGTVNSKDPTPFFVGDNLFVNVVRTGNRVLLSWQALPGARSYLECKPSFGLTGAWQTIFTTNTADGGRMEFSDPWGDRTQRVYRVRMDIP